MNDNRDVLFTNDTNLMEANEKELQIGYNRMEFIALLLTGNKKRTE